MAYFFKIKLKPGTVTVPPSKTKTFCILCEKRPTNGVYFGFEVDSKTGDIKNCFFKSGVLVETKRLVLKETVSQVTELFEDLKYGNLTTITPKEQKQRYGIEDDYPSD